MGKVISFSLDIPFSQSPRTIWVYLPDSYEHTTKLYPVLYMFDGHNLFFDDVATYGKSWGIKKYLDANRLDLVVVGEDCNHTGNLRISEYCPLKPQKIKGFEDVTQQGDITAAWFTNVLKPTIEKKFRVHRDRKFAGIGGSSMGGLMADYMACAYNDTFSRFACVSTASEFSFKRLLKLIETSSFMPNTKLYRSFGTHELKRKDSEMKMLNQLVRLSNAFIDHNCTVHNDIILNGYHNEATWEKIVPDFLAYLYPEIFN